MLAASAANGGAPPSSLQSLLVFIHQARDLQQLLFQGTLKGIFWFLTVIPHPSVCKLSKLSLSFPHESHFLPTV